MSFTLLSQIWQKFVSAGLLCFRSYLIFEKNICISDILRILVCDMVGMPGTLIPFAVWENLRGHSWNFTLSKKSERGDIFTELKHLFHWQKKIILFQEIKRHAIASRYLYRVSHKINPSCTQLYIFTVNACNTGKVFIWLVSVWEIQILWFWHCLNKLMHV